MRPELVAAIKTATSQENAVTAAEEQEDAWEALTSRLHRSYEGYRAAHDAATAGDPQRPEGEDDR